jgi:glycosyltransferase involved in cell wall biosynthesis
MSKKIYFDNRWLGKNGIGRYSQEIGLRIKSSKIQFIEGNLPTTINEIFRFFPKLNRINLVYSPGYVALPWFKNQVITIHDLILINPNIGSRLQRLYFNYYLKRKIMLGHIKVVTVSEHSRDELGKWAKIPLDEIAIIPNGISSAIFEAGERLQQYQRGRSLIYVGNNKRHKNFELLVKATHFLMDEWKIVLIGTDLNSSGIPSRHSVTILADITDDELAGYYLQSDVVVTTSLYEGFCMPVLEASYLGCKVVHLGVLPTVSEIIGDAAFSTNGSFEPKKLAEILTIANRSQVKLDEKSRRSLPERFDWDNSARLLKSKFLMANLK